MTTFDTPAEPRHRHYGLSWVLAVSALEVLALLFGAGPPFQPVLSIIFVATCPGFLLLELDHPADPVAKIVLGIASSLSVNMLIVSVALVGDRGWIVPAIIATLAGLAFLPRYQLRAVVGDLAAPEAAAPAPLSAAKATDSRTEISAHGAAATARGSAPVPLSLDLSDGMRRQVVLVDLNQASVDEIATLPSVNRTVAQAIGEFRQSHGPFTHFDQLLEVRGIGPSRLAAIQSTATLMRAYDDNKQEES